MSTFQVSYNRLTKTATVQKQGDTVPEGSVAIGTFEHPDPVYPDSLMIYHGVRDLLYHRSEANPAETAMFPNNITDLPNIIIVLDDVIELTSLAVTPTMLALVVGATGQLTVTKTPAAAEGTPTWSTSAAGIATVNASGLVTAVAAGTATITATLNGMTDTSDITVTTE